MQSDSGSRTDSVSPVRGSSVSPLRTGSPRQGAGGSPARASQGASSRRRPSREGGKLSSDWALPAEAGALQRRHSAKSSEDLVRAASDDTHSQLSSAGTAAYSSLGSSRGGRQGGGGAMGGREAQVILHTPKVLGPIWAEPAQGPCSSAPHTDTAIQDTECVPESRKGQVPIVKQHGIACGSGVCNVQ